MRDLHGDPVERFDAESLNLRAHFRGDFRVHSSVRFRGHFRQRVHGLNYAFRVLCVV